MSIIIKSQILEQLDRLPDDKQKQVLDFARALETIPQVGVSGKDLLRFAGFIPKDDLLLMEQAIEEGCNRSI